MIADSELNHFYVTLPSNSSLSFYGHQKPSNYKTRLSSAVNLDPTLWEVGLSQIIYPRSWANIKDPSFTIRMPVDGAEKVPLVTHVFKLSGTRFENPAHLVADFDEKLARHVRNVPWREEIRIKFERPTQRAVIDLSEAFILELPEQLAIPLGFGRHKNVVISGVPSDGGEYDLTTDKTRLFIGKSIKSPHPVNPDRLITELYVYTSIVKPHRVGDALAPLLRNVIDIGAGTGETVVAEFRHVHYMPLQTGCFEEIEIFLADSGGREVEFEYGDVISTLHFRRRQ